MFEDIFQAQKIFKIEKVLILRCAVSIADNSNAEIDILNCNSGKKTLVTAGKETNLQVKQSCAFLLNLESDT